jgi:electron transfer flavoprotein alpha subunit
MVFVRNVYSGKLNLQVGLKGDPPYLISLQPGKFNDHEFMGTRLPNVVNLDIRVSDKIVIKRKVLEIVQAVQNNIDLSHAEVIVAGGRGLESKENFRIIFDLAKVLGASVGATRPVIDNGWLPKEHQVGSSGQSVSPKLYIACGISGRIQHLLGITNARCIVAINKDSNAPIFQVADYGIVGDLFTIVPAITESVKEMGNFI